LPTPPADCIVDDHARLQALASYHILDTDYEAAFNGIVKLAATVCQTPIAVINFIDQDRQWFKAEIGLGVRETPLDTSICRHAILEHDLMVINDTLTDPRTQTNPLACAPENALRFYAGALLKSGGHALGTLCVLDHTPRNLSQQQLNALCLMRDQVMHLLELRRHHVAQRRIVQELDESRNELQRQAHIDPLTGLLNRRAFESRLQFELQSPPTGLPPGAVLMIDLDDFKAVNDTFGHLHGDQTLKHIAQLLRKATRASDVLARWGGDEFLVLLPATDGQQALEIAQRISRALLDGFDDTTGGLRISASIGITPTFGYESVSDVIHAVDTAMYQAKRNGVPGCRITLINAHER
jgi:diguanylate cyclase (GGDEF)-like protein